MKQYTHLFQHGSCIFCHKPLAFMSASAIPWRGGYVLPAEIRDEHCPACEAWHKKAEQNGRNELTERLKDRKPHNQEDILMPANSSGLRRKGNERTHEPNNVEGMARLARGRR